MSNKKTVFRGAPFDILSWVFFCAVALLMIGLTSFQQYIMYNPVPVWDMLHGYLGFLEQIAAGNWSAWFVPHNEHRIFVQRILFWIDNYAFHGTNVFLIVANSLLIALNITLLAAIGLHERRKWIILPLLVAWCYLLCQGENITWAFQGQFHEAYLVPLAGLYLLAVKKERITVARVVGAVFVGWLSVGTMGNGVAASPMFLLLALILRMPLWTIAMLVVGNVVQFVVLQLLRTSSPPSILHAVASDPLLFFRFFARLIGSPFYYLFGENDSGFQIEIIGAFLVIIFAMKVLQILRSRNTTPRVWALIAFTCYVLISYAGATVSRMGIGIDASLVPHYTTPAILAWAAVALLYVDWMERQFEIVWRRIVFIVFAGIMLGFQCSHLNFSPRAYFEMRVGLLGMAMGVSDEPAIKMISDPRFVDETEGYIQPAYKASLGYFQSYPYRDIRVQLGRTFAAPQIAERCSMTPLERMATTDPKFSRFADWIDVRASDMPYPTFVRLLDDHGVQVGFGLVSSRWVDRHEKPASDGVYQFRVEGYVVTQSDSPVTVVAEANRKSICQAVLTVRPPR